MADAHYSFARARTPGQANVSGTCNEYGYVTKIFSTLLQALCFRLSGNSDTCLYVCEFVFTNLIDTNTDLCDGSLVQLILSRHITASISRESLSMAPSATWAESRQSSCSFGCQWQESMWIFQPHPTSTSRSVCWQSDFRLPYSRHLQGAPPMALIPVSTSPIW